MNRDYGSWSLAAIKEELRKRNAKLTGKKAVLIQRLHDYDCLFGAVVNAPETTYVIEVPEREHFRDVNSESQIPELNETDIQIYSALAEREDFETSIKMYEDSFLLTFRAAQDKQNGDQYFIQATCASEMRKNVIYSIIVKYESHIIIETQCECAAGEGPHAQCKHAMMVLYAIFKFGEDKYVKTRRSSTSNLQTFHQPTKFYMGNPVEAENLILKRKDKTLKDIVNFDPRPSSSMSKEKYVENFKNLVNNFCGQKKKSMPIAQLTLPANKKALFEDHDYFEKTTEEIFLDSSILNDDQLQHIEKITSESKKIWKEQRLHRLHSSNFGKICKQEKNKMELAKSFLKNVDICTPAIKHGIKYESKAVEEFKRTTKLETKKCGIIIHKEKQFLACTPDRLIGEEAVLEVKCPFTARNEKISPETVKYLYLCDETGFLKLQKTHDYYYQIQGQMLCTGRSKAYFCVYTLKDFCSIVIEKDEDFIISMCEKLFLFYDNYYKKAFLDRHLYTKRT